MATGIGIGVGIQHLRQGQFTLPYETASFALVVDAWEKRWNRDFLFGRHSGNGVSVPLLLDADGNNPMPQEWFQDGTPDGEGGLRFAMTKEATGFAAFRFGSVPRDTAGREITGPNLRPEVQRILNWRLQLGPLVYDVGSILGDADPYFFLVSPRLGDWTAKTLPSMYPRLIFGAYGERLGRPTGEYRFSEFAFLSSGNRDVFSVVFPDRAHAAQHPQFAWRGRAVGSTPTENTGPSASNNTSSFIYCEATDPAGGTLALPREQETGRLLDMELAPGTQRMLTIEHCTAGVAFRLPTSGLRVDEYSAFADPNLVSQGDAPTQSTLFRGWPYADNRMTGQTVHGYGNSGIRTFTADGGWCSDTVALRDDTTRVVLQPAWENSVTLAPIQFGDIAIRSIGITGQHAT